VWDKQCPNCGRWQGTEDLCPRCREMAEMDPRELIGRRARRNAARGPTREDVKLTSLTPGAG